MRELLSEDGSIYVHLDDNMAFHVKVLMDEIFGHSNFRNWITQAKLYRWNSEIHGWEMIPAQLDTNVNRVVASIAKLSTYALGVDQTPPAIDLIAPITSTIASTVVPYIYAYLSDSGSGIDPSSIQVQINGHPQPKTYITNTGELTVKSPTGLINGQNRLSITGKDNAGNSLVFQTVFGKALIHVYLPNVMK